MKKLFTPKMADRKAKEPMADMPLSEFEAYFKVGVSDDFILIREDFPIDTISPGDFSKLLVAMFQKNDEVRHGK